MVAVVEALQPVAEAVRIEAKAENCWIMYSIPSLFRLICFVSPSKFRFVWYTLYRNPNVNEIYIFILEVRLGNLYKMSLWVHNCNQFIREDNVDSTVFACGVSSDRLLHVHV